ncbi:uncharacterized protein LOC141674298 [Apium graveolens]|uniref:uncharacterized protein LOC141674298 n=1 Tax=Apium graveolens TaxID=4045 RepID=UPI003D7AD7D4
MSLLAWNCRGLAKPRAVRFLKEIVYQYRPCIIFLETLGKIKKIEEVCKIIGFARYHAVDVQGHGGGLALFWKTDGGVQVMDSCSNYIDFEVNHAQVGRWRYTGVYGYPERSRRREAWNMIRSLAERSSIPWCLIGDFNDMVAANEKRGGHVHPRSLMQGFSETIFECGLMDLGFEGEEFTWEKFRGTEDWVQERLDRGLANQGWKELFPDAVVKVGEVSMSDHIPIFLSLNRKVYMKKQMQFKFENMWIREKECYGLINECWMNGGSGSILDKMVRCCIKLEEWGGGLVKEMRDNLVKYRNQMRILRARRDAYGVSQYNAARWEYLGLLERQEVYWKQRAKQF